MDEIGGEPVIEAPQLTTNVDGFFEFWLGDSTEKAGYDSATKFKLTWERIGIESGMIDYIDIFPITLPVDVSDDNPERNKSVSNLLAKGWEQHRTSDNHIVHGINEVNLAIDTTKRNKLVSNSLAILWQKHRLFSFNTGTIPPSADEGLAEWEQEDSDQYGAHGLRPVELEGQYRSSMMFNKLLCNAYANKWDEHVNFDFLQHSIPTSGTNEVTPHGLLPTNLADLPDNPTNKEMHEYNTYNRLVSNRLMKEMLESLAAKPATFVKTIKKEDWKGSFYETNVYQQKIFHGLESQFVTVFLFHQQERFDDDGNVEMGRAVFHPEDIYIIDDNNIEISVTKLEDVDIMILAHTEKLNVTDYQG